MTFEKRNPSRTDIATRDDLNCGRQAMHFRSFPVTLTVVQELDCFSWSDDSWDPMVQEVVGLYSSKVTATTAIQNNLVPYGEMIDTASPRAFELLEVPCKGHGHAIGSETPLFAVFETKYHRSRYYDDEVGSIHPTYRTDGTGVLLQVFAEKDAAEQYAAEATAALITGGGNPFQYGLTFDELTSMSEPDFHESLKEFGFNYQWRYLPWPLNIPISYRKSILRKYRNNPSWSALPPDFFDGHVPETYVSPPNILSCVNSRLHDPQTMASIQNRIWAIMDRVRLHKVKTMFLQDDLIEES